MLHICDVMALFPLSYSAYTDYKRRIIPDYAVLLISVFAVAKQYTNGDSIVRALLEGAGVGTFLLLASALGRADGMGGGDIKLCTAIGTLFGFVETVVLLFFSVAAMLIYGMARKEKFLPFAPFMLGAVLAYKVILPIIVKE